MRREVKVVHRKDFHHTDRLGDKLFDIIASDSDRLATWNRAMTANEGNRVPALGMFPWQSLLEGAEHSNRALIVDVGGGRLFFPALHEIRLDTDTLKASDSNLKPSSKRIPDLETESSSKICRK